MAELVMPRLSDTMEEGTILRWLAADGEEIERGQEIVEIETDKATMTYESDLAGILKIVAAEGDTLPVGALIAYVGEVGTTTAEESVAAAATPTTAPAEALREEYASPAAPPPAAAPSPAETTSSESPPPGPAPRDSGWADGERVKASPLARRLASESGVDLHGLTGSGPGGRIVKADVLTATGEEARAAKAPASATPATAGTAEPTPPTVETSPAGGLAGVATAKGENTEVELTRTQQTIARRMAESKATVPHFALAMDVDMEECAKLRAQLKQHAAEAVPTYNDMVVKAAALALREHPRANSSYRDGRLQLHSRVNVGVAVSVEGEAPVGGALVVPTVFDADLKALGEIAREARALAAKVREGTITPPELGGGTFTVSNLGMYGIASFTAIVNPPQAAILSVGAVAPRAVVHEGEIVSRQTMTVTLACDHRILYGADAARFLARIRELLQAPASLTL